MLSPKAPATLPFTVTPEAAEHLRTVLETQGRDDLAIRVYLRDGGGCGGPGFGLGLDLQKAGDLAYSHETMPFIVDPHSAPYLEGVILDYQHTDQGGAFLVGRPKSGGCGSGGCGCKG